VCGPRTTTCKPAVKMAATAGAQVLADIAAAVGGVAAAGLAEMADVPDLVFLDFLVSAGWAAAHSS
jgi:hypothetical protein